MLDNENKRKENENVEERVKAVIAQALHKSASEIKMDSEFTKDLGADSLDNVELIMAIEEEFGIVVPDTDTEKFTQVSELKEYIEAKLSAKTQAVE